MLLESLVVVEEALICVLSFLRSTVFRLIKVICTGLYLSVLCLEYPNCFVRNDGMSASDGIFNIHMIIGTPNKFSLFLIQNTNFHTKFSDTVQLTEDEKLKPPMRPSYMIKILLLSLELKFSTKTMIMIYILDIRFTNFVIFCCCW